jgi:hypothetical protein
LLFSTLNDRKFIIDQSINQQSIVYISINQSIIMAKKGKKIRFIGGKYGSRKGWINDDKKHAKIRPQ